MSQPGASIAEIQAAILTFRFPTGPHFKDLWVMNPITFPSNSVFIYNTADVAVSADTTAGFTGFAQYGLQDNTNWSANTYKTLYSHTGKGLVLAIVGPTAGGAETSTLRVTIDGGAAQPSTVTNANAERAVWMCGNNQPTQQYTTAQAGNQYNPALDAATLSTFQITGGAPGSITIPGWRHAAIFGMSLLRYDISCLIEMKHSASITNSVATAYSAVLVRKGITS